MEENKTGSGTATVKKMGIFDKLVSLLTLTFGFINVRPDKDRDGNLIAILTLDEPIDQVVGSQTYETDGGLRNYTAVDVEEIRVHQDNFVDGFSFDPDGTSGEYSGDELILDVAKNGTVWLVKEKFSQAGNRMRREFREDRTKEVIAQNEKRRLAGNGGGLNPQDTAGN